MSVGGQHFRRSACHRPSAILAMSCRTANPRSPDQLRSVLAQSSNVPPCRDRPHERPSRRCSSSVRRPVAFGGPSAMRRRRSLGRNIFLGRRRNDNKNIRHIPNSHRCRNRGASIGLDPVCKFFNLRHPLVGYASVQHFVRCMMGYALWPDSLPWPVDAVLHCTKSAAHRGKRRRDDRCWPGAEERRS